MKVLLSFALLLVSAALVFSGTAHAKPWTSSRGLLPPGAAVGGGVGSQREYVCRAQYRGAWHPGRAFKSGGRYKCHFGYGGKEVVASSFEVLTSPVLWSKIVYSNGRVPKGAIEGGKENGVTLFVCRAWYRGGFHSGKLFKARASYICNIGYGGLEIVKKRFNVAQFHCAKIPAAETPAACRGPQGIHLDLTAMRWRDVRGRRFDPQSRFPLMKSALTMVIGSSVRMCLQSILKKRLQRALRLKVFIQLRPGGTGMLRLSKSKHNKVPQRIRQLLRRCPIKLYKSFERWKVSLPLQHVRGSAVLKIRNLKNGY